LRRFLTPCYDLELVEQGRSFVHTHTGSRGAQPASTNDHAMMARRFKTCMQMSSGMEASIFCKLHRPRHCQFFQLVVWVELAEAVRFELTDGCPSPVFKTGALNRSATLPAR
jgi:hypothetical protein